MADIAMICSYCKGTEFYIQDGLYFCSECDIQCENVIETEYENNFNNEATHRVRFSKSNQKDQSQTRRLTSYEEYNFMLVGMIDEILEIEDIPNFKVTCCRLWMTYLRETESAFFSKTPQIPKLAANYRRADAEILYNMKPRPKYQAKKRNRSKGSAFDGNETDDGLELRRRRKQMRKSEKIISQALSESWRSDSVSMSSSLANLSIETIISDHEEAELDIEFSGVAEIAKKNPKKPAPTDTKRIAEDQIYTHRIPKRYRFQILTGKTLLSILYYALNICKSNIQLSDLVRFINEGYIKYYKCKAHLPEELLDQNIPLTFERLHSYNIVTFNLLREEVSYFECGIPDLKTSIQTPDLTKLAKRYIEDMNLPNQTKDLVQRLIAFHPPKMMSATGFRLINNFEGRAMGYIVFILKLLFGMDGKREEEMSRNARRINDAIEILQLKEKFKKIFVFKDWVNYIEYRKFILEKYYYATMYQENYSNDKPYTAFNSMLRMLNPDFKPTHIVLSTNKRQNTYEKRKKEEKKQSAKGLAMKLLGKHKEAEGFTKMDEFSFQSSLTPQKDYFATILKNDKNKTINRAIASVHYSKHSFDVYLDPQKLVDEFAEKSLPLKVKVSTFPKPFKCSEVEKEIKTPECDYRPKFLLTDTEWLADLKKQKKAHEIGLKDKKRKFNRVQTEKVLKARKFWRKAVMIREKQNASNCLELSQSEIDEIDEKAENDEIECSDEMLEGILYEIEQEATNDLTLVTPDFNLWHNDFSPLKLPIKTRIEKMENLPESFQWLLGFASSILHQTPNNIYEELLMIERQFVTELQPIELIENVLARKLEYPNAGSVQVSKIKSKQGW